jgi:hypothetical protein
MIYFQHANVGALVALIVSAVQYRAQYGAQAFWYGPDWLIGLAKNI